MEAQLVDAKPLGRSDVVERLRVRQIAPVTGRPAELLALFDAQLGEIGWHSTHYDAGIDSVSDAHAASMIELATRCGIKEPRILELGAYAHHSAQIAAETLGGSAVSHDISAASVAVGSKRALERGYRTTHTAVAGDFHSLPFEDDFFDITFIASAVHHTWRPWEVMREMVRVTRPGGVIHLENEPVGRDACLYSYRGNRPEEFTDYERALDNAGLTHTVTSPFPGSRAEKLFGIIENDRIPIEVYERALLSAGKALTWNVDVGACVNSFEIWLIEKRPTIEEIATRILSGVEAASAKFSIVDEAGGLNIPHPDQVWPLAYRIYTALSGMNDGDARAKAKLFGGALKASVIKSGNRGVFQNLLKSSPSGSFRRALRDVDGVLIDDSQAREHGVTFANVLPDPDKGEFGPDWYVMPEDNGSRSLANIGSDCYLPIDCGEGFLILRAYSAAANEPYYFTVTKNSEVVYSHCVARSESHLGKIYINKGDKIVVHHHDKDGLPVDVQFRSRLMPRFVPAG